MQRSLLSTLGLSLQAIHRTIHEHVLLLFSNRDLFRGIGLLWRAEGGSFQAATTRLLGMRTSDWDLLPKGFYKFILVEEPYVID